MENWEKNYDAWKTAAPEEDETVYGLDDYGNEISTRHEYFVIDAEFGEMSEDTFKDLVKNYKTPCDVIAEENTVDDWNGDEIAKGERYLLVDGDKLKIYDDSTFEDVCCYATKYEVDLTDCCGVEW